LLHHGRYEGNAATDYGSVLLGRTWGMEDVATWFTTGAVISAFYGCGFFGLTATVLGAYDITTPVYALDI